MDDMDNRLPYNVSGDDSGRSAAAAAAANALTSHQQRQQQSEIELLLADQQQRHLQQQQHQQQQQQTTAVLHAGAVSATTTAQHEPGLQLPSHYTTTTTNLNHPITMRNDVSLSDFIGGYSNDNRNLTDAAALQSMLLSSSNTPSHQQHSLPYLRQFEPMNQSLPAAMLFQQELQQQQQQADLLARYQQQQQRLLHQQQQLLNQQQLMGRGGGSSNPNRAFGVQATMGQSANFQEIMMLQQQQRRRQQQQQQHAQMPDDVVLDSNTNFASLSGYGDGTTASIRRLQLQQQQRQQQQQQSELLQHQLSNQQQQRLMMNDSLFLDPIEQLHQQQQQLQLEQQLRRRSSMSSGSASFSAPLGSFDQQQLGGDGRRPANTNQLFGGVHGTLTDYSRLSNTAPLLQHSLLASSSNQSRFDSSGVNRPASISQLHPDEIAIIENADMEIAQRETKKRTRSFPEKLMNAMMEHEDEQAVAWLPDGKSFVIVSPDLFVNEVLLGGDFKQSKYASFVRKLHRWGFTRLTSGTGTDCFHHPQFNRNFPDWSSRISCITMKEAAKEAPITAVDLAPTAAGRSRTTKQQAVKSTDAASGAVAADRGIVDRPPSLAGVERFIRTKSLEAGASLKIGATTTNPHDTSKATDATPGRRLQLQPIDEAANLGGDHRRDSPEEQKDHAI